MASGAGVELRRPFFSREVLQFTFSSPERWRRRGRIDKYVHRMALRGLLPETVRQRQSKAEFSITYLWYLSQLEELLGRKPPGHLGAWVDAEHLSRLLLSYRGATTGKRAVRLRMRMIWSLFGCAAADTRQENRVRDITHLR